MSKPIIEPFHPYHLLYLVADPHRDENDLNVFFEALAKVDSLERRWMIGFASSAIGTEAVPELASEEDESDARLLRFRNRCADILNGGMENFFLAFGIVAYICNLLHAQSDPTQARANARWVLRAAEYFQQRAGSGRSDQCFADKVARMAEEQSNNAAANVKLSRDRYYLFCCTVVKAMLPQLPELDAFSADT
jgi:hypothetical protein